jgi:hypothetical protein
LGFPVRTLLFSSNQCRTLHPIRGGRRQYILQRVSAIPSYFLNRCFTSI